MDLGEALIRELTTYAMDECTEDLELFARWVDKTLMATLENSAVPRGGGYLESIR
jgi:asparaginyl-tRNA synthetase